MTVTDGTLRGLTASKLLARGGVAASYVQNLGPEKLRFAASKAVSAELRLGLRLLAGDTVFVSALELPAHVQAVLGLKPGSTASVTFQGDHVVAVGG